ncbi:GTPase Era, mitochondrial-like [Mercenaria mercenaria]|uniref:GTPase Era, mitochondrial-like n=1 Tax=Mercenaria mercenaria TaxID=6596 RepID=UPI00234F431E|nr:GTPase Era, mitochondrial-like [Mercenaria mercenaria]
MLRTFIQKSPLFRRYTWSQCAYYLQTSTYAQLSETANSKSNPVRNESDAFSQPEQNENDVRLVENSKITKKQEKAPTSRVIDRNPEDLYRRYFMTPDQPEDARLLRVAIIGAPNAGKSTLINTLMGWKVNAVSKKVHTTRKNANTVFTIENAQIILVDTPGVITKSEKKRHQCDKNMRSDPERSLHEADAVGVIVDASNYWTRNQLHTELLKVLYLHKDIPSFLILNKIDVLRSKPLGRQQVILLGVTRRLSEGKIGGKEFGRTRERKKKDRKPKDLFDELEQKYGKLKVNKKMVSEENKSDAQAETDVSEDFRERLQQDTYEVFKRGLQDELSDIIKLHSEKANTTENIDEKRSVPEGAVKHFMNRKAKNSAEITKTKVSKHDSKEELLDVSTHGRMEVDVADNVNKNVHSDKNESLDLNSDEHTSVEVITCDTDNIMCDIKKDTLGNHICNDEFLTENETAMIGEQTFSDSDKDLSSHNRFSDFPKAKTVNPVGESSDNEKVKIELEDSYQSEFLARIQSLQAKMQEDSTPSRNDSEVREHSESQEENSKLKEAVAAVKDKHGWSCFDKVFPVSALDGSGIDQIKEYLLEISRPADWIYHSSVISDQHPFEIAKMCVTQSFLDNMDSYLPYVINPEIISWDVDSHNHLNISMDITVANRHEMNLIFSKGGAQRIRDISASARQALMDAFQCEVRFKLAIRLKKRR